MNGTTFTILLNAETAQAALDIATFFNKVSSLAKTAAGLGAGFLGLKEVASSVDGMIRLAGQLEQLQQRTGSAVQDLVAMQRVLKESGNSADDLATFLTRMQNSIVNAAEQGGLASRVFSDLNLNLKDLATKDAATQFKLIGQAIAQIENPAKRTQAVLAVFGRGAGGLSNAFANPQAFAEAFQYEQAFGDAMARNAEGFHQTEIAMQRLGEQGQRFFAGVMDQLAPLFTDFVQRITSIDLTPIGQKFGALVTVIIDAWKDGKLPEMIGLLIEAGGELGVMGIQALWQTLLKTLEFLTSAQGGQIWVGLFNAMMTFGVKAAEFILQALLQPVTYMAGAFDWLYDQIKIGFEKVGNYLKDIFSDALNFFINGWNKTIGARFGHSIQPVNKQAGQVDQGISFADALARNGSLASDAVSGASSYLDKQLNAARQILTINTAITGQDNLQLTALQRLGALIDAQVAKRKAASQAEGATTSVPLQTKLMDMREVERLQKEKILVLDAQLAEVENNWLLTTAEKYEQKKKILEEQKQLYSDLAKSLRERAELEDSQVREATLGRADNYEKQAVGKSKEIGKLGVDPYSVTQQMHSAIVDLQNSWGTFAQQVAHSFTSVIGSAISSISTGITGLIEGTKTWGQALTQIGNTIVTQIIQAIVEMGVKWVVTHVLMGQALTAFHALGRLLGWEQVAETNAQEAAKAPALAVNAANASVSSYGAAAIIGIAAMVAAIGIGIAAALGAFESGGFTGAGSSSSVAGVVHRGEFVFSAPAVNRIGVGNLEALHSGSGGGGGGPTGGSTTHNVTILADQRKYQDAHNDPTMEGAFIDLMNKHAWRYR